MTILDKYKKYKKINTIIANIGPFKAPITITVCTILRKENLGKNEVYENIKPYDIFNNAGFNINLSSSYILLSNKAVKDPKKPNMPLSVCIYPRDFHSILKLFDDKIFEWFYDDKYLDLYTYDADDNILQVNEMKYNKLGLSITIKGIQNEKLGIKPAVVECDDGRYKGVRLITSVAHMIFLTIDELKELRDCLKNTINNFYPIVLNSINVSMGYSKMDSEEK